MKQGTKRTIALACATVLTVGTVGMLTACGEKDDGKVETNIEWLIMRDGDTDITLNENPVMNYWQKETGITVRWYDPVSQSEAWRQQLMSGEYSHVVDLSLNTQVESLKALEGDGVVWNIAPYIEECMPNLSKIFKDDPAIKDAVYLGDKLYTVPIIEEAPSAWGGYMYRHDMVTSVHGEDFDWPSGQEEPTTIADWEFILDSVKTYYTNKGIQGAYPMYLAPEGHYATGILLQGFGVGGNDYVENGQVKFGLAEDGFKDYLDTMNKWFNKGYISPDYAEQDIIFPMTDFTNIYTNRLGVFLGFTNFLDTQLQGQINDYVWDPVKNEAVPIPVEGIDVRPLASPVKNVGDKTVGVVSPDTTRASFTAGYAVTKTANEATMKFILKAMDWFFSEEGSRTRTMGLSSEQDSANAWYYQQIGLEGGARKPNSAEWTDVMDNMKEYTWAGNKKSATPLTAAADRMPGVRIKTPTRKADGQDYAAEGTKVWNKYGDENTYWYVLNGLLSETETTDTNVILQNINEYAIKKINDFIKSSSPVTDEAFAEFKAGINNLQLSKYLEIKQKAYDGNV